MRTDLGTCMYHENRPLAMRTDLIWYVHAPRSVKSSRYVQRSVQRSRYFQRSVKSVQFWYESKNDV